MDNFNQMTPRDFLEILKRRTWSLILPFLSIVITAVAVAYMLPPVYRSTATILIEEQDVPQDFVMTTVTGFAEQHLQQLERRIMSFTKLVEIIKRLDLYPELRERNATEEIVTKMKEDTSLETVSAEIIDRRTRRRATATIAFTLSYEGKNPSKVRQVANVLTSLYLSESLQVREKLTQDTSEFLENELDKIRRQLSDLESKIARFKENHVNELPEMLAANMRGLDDMRRKLEVAEDRLFSRKERALYLDSQLSGVKSHLEDQDERITTRSRLEELKVQLVYLTERYSDEYPDVKKTRAEIAELEKQMATEDAKPDMADRPPNNPVYISISGRLKNTQAEVVLLENQMKEFNLGIAEYQRRIAATPRVEKEYNALVIERNNTKAKYNDLMAKHMEAQVAQGLEEEQKGERFTLIEPPRLPEKPVKPNRLGIMMIGVVLGLGAGVGWAALREFSDDAVHKIDQLERIANFPVLAGIPRIVTQRDMRFRHFKRYAMAAGSLVVVAGGLLVFHYYVMNLSVFWVKLMRRLNI